MNWLVLRCPSNRTLALAAALTEQGAWTPVWPKPAKQPKPDKLVQEPVIPGYVFLPEQYALDLPPVPCVRFWFMRGSEYQLTRVPDSQFTDLRRIAAKPVIEPSNLPRPGMMVMMPPGPWQGLRAKVISCTARLAVVEVEGFSQPVRLDPCYLVSEKAKQQEGRRALRHRNAVNYLG